MRHDLMISIFHEATYSGAGWVSLAVAAVALHCDCHTWQKMIIALIFASLCLFAHIELLRYCWLNGMAVCIKINDSEPIFELGFFFLKPISTA